MLSALHNGTADSNTTIAAGPVLRGPALWAAQRPQRDLAAVPVHTQFSSTLRLPRAALGPDPGATHDIPPPPPVLLVVWARVDTEFEQQPGAKPSPALPPQTHLAQRRRNSAWCVRPRALAREGEGGWARGRTGGLAKGQTDRRAGGRAGGRVGRRTDGRMDERTGGGRAVDVQQSSDSVPLTTLAGALRWAGAACMVRSAGSVR